MYILIRDRIKDLSEENGWFRELDYYVKILVEQLTIKYEKSFNSIEQYGNSLKLFNEYLNEERVYTHQHFIASRQRILNILEGLIITLSKNLDIIPEKDYRNNFNDTFNLYILTYEQERIEFFKQYPAKHKNYYNHSRLIDQYAFKNGYIFFPPDTKLIESMQQDIKQEYEYLEELFRQGKS